MALHRYQNKMCFHHYLRMFHKASAKAGDLQTPHDTIMNQINVKCLSLAVSTQQACHTNEPQPPCLLPDWARKGCGKEIEFVAHQQTSMWQLATAQCISFCTSIAFVGYPQLSPHDFSAY